MNKFLSTTIILFFAIISCSNEKKSSLKSGTDTTLTNADTPTQEISTVQQLKPFKTQVDTSIYLLDNYGYKDKRGNIIIPPRFMDAREFSENLAAVEVVDEEYEQKRTVSVPLTHQKTIWGYIRPDGSFQIKPRFDNAYPFKKGEAKVQIGNHLALVDTSGTILKEFDHIREKKIDERTLP